MKYFIGIFLIFSFALEANFLDKLEQIKNKAKTIGKATPINIALYAKNPSSKCKLTIVNKINPYNKDITKTKLEPIMLNTGEYYRKDIMQILKGEYEFEYIWSKDNFQDKSLKTVRIFAYHDTTLKIHKKVNLSYKLTIPKECQ